MSLDDLLTSQELLYLATGCRLMAVQVRDAGDLDSARAYLELATKCERMAALVCAAE